MPTGRPDYWYGTALYFDDSPGDGELTRGPTANWAYDHVNNPSAHHVKAGGGDVDHADITNVLASQHHTKYSDAEALSAVRAIVDDTPVDAATTEPISSNWAFDHNANVSAHHEKLHERYENNLLVGREIGSAGARGVYFFPYGTTTFGAYLQRAGGTDGYMQFENKGAGHITFTADGAQRFEILST
ncbi:hypothetical protein LCGC14_2678250, partial [marine sediment metagenome]